MAKQMTLEEWIIKALKVHGNKYDYSKAIYLGIFIKIYIVCPLHGGFWQRPNDHLNGAGCPKCKAEKTSLIKRSTLKEFKEKAFEIYGNNNDYSKFIYEGNDKKGCIICLVDKNHGEYCKTPNAHISQKQGCPKCFFDRRKYILRISQEDIIGKFREKHGDRYGYNSFIYNGMHEKSLIDCKKHGQFLQNAHEHLKGSGCPVCKASKGEAALENIFKKYNIKFQPQYTILNEENKYRYDFYLPEYNTIIEFHGQQHYEYKQHFHKTYEKFIKSQETDKYKIELANKNNIRLIEFHYKSLNLPKEKFEELVITTLTEGVKDMQLIKTYVDVNKFVIWGDEPADGDQKRPRLVFGFRDGNPRITVYTGVPGQNGLITFPSDYPTMVACMNMLKDVIAGAPGTKFSIDSLGTVYENNKPTKDKRVVGTLYMGKSKDGIIYFSVMAEGKPKLVFSVKPSPYHVFRDGDKNVIPDSVMSCKLANGIADLVLDIIGRILEAYTAEEYSTVRKPAPIKGQQDTATKGQAKTADFSGELDDLGL